MDCFKQMADHSVQEERLIPEYRQVICRIYLMV